MDDYDYILSPDSSANSSVIQIEQIDEVVNFDKGFYVEDKAVHILNLLSTNNKYVDLQKYKQYWDNKVLRVLELYDDTIKTNFNNNIYPLVSLKKKVSEQDPDDNTRMAYQYEEDNVILESTESYLKLRNNLIGPYSLATENKMYAQLAPTESAGSFVISKNTDCFAGSERMRMLAPIPEYKGDAFTLVGYYNNGKGQVMEFDVNKYKQALSDLVKGDLVYVVMNDGKNNVGTVVSNNQNLKFVVEGRKTPLTYTFSSAFLVYPVNFHPKIAKKDLLEKNIAFVGDGLEISSLTGNDIVTLQPFLRPSTLDEFVNDYPTILDNITKNEPLTKYFSSFKAGLKPVKIIQKQGKFPHKLRLQEQRESVTNKTDDLDTVQKIYTWLRDIKNFDNGKDKDNDKEEQKKEGNKYQKVFTSVEEMINDGETIRTFNEDAVAALISATYFKQGRKEYPVDVTVFELKHIVLDDNKIAWNIGSTIPIGTLQKKETEKWKTYKECVEFLKRYKKQRNIKPYKTPFTQYVYDTKRSYANFQGHEEFSSDNIPEFGVQMDTMENTDLDSEDSIIGNVFSEQIIIDLATIAKIEISGPMVSYINKMVQFKEELLESKTKASILEVFKKLMICFSLFIIFAQIYGQNVPNVFSYPLSKNKKDVGLITYMISVLTKKVSIDPRFSRVLSDPNINNVLPNSTDAFISTIDKVLVQKQFLKILLDSTYNKNNAVDGKEDIVKGYPLWITYRPRKSTRKSKKKENEKPITPLLFIVHKKHRYVLADAPKPLTQFKPSIVESVDFTNEVTPTTLYGSIADNNSFLGQDPNFDLVKAEKWNQFSDVLENLAQIHPQLSEFLKTAIKVPITTLFSFVLSDMKDVLGKIAYNFKLKSEKELATHLEFLNDFYRSSNQDIAVATAQFILANILNVSQASFPNVNDVKYLVLYMCIITFLQFDRNKDTGEVPNTLCVTTSYLLTLFQKKVAINTMTPEQATFHFQHERELRKQKLMQMYKGMEDNIRHLNKKAVDMGLLTREQLLQEADIKEDIDIRIENERDDYDMNERED